jgi:hypothetical protein
MKARIVKNELSGIYTNDFISKNLDKVINGLLVSEWQLTEVLPSESLLKPLWNGSEWIEGVTPEEIAEQELEQQKLLKQQQYEELLLTDWYVVRFVEKGVEIPEEILKQRQEIRNKYK